MKAKKMGLKNIVRMGQGALMANLWGRRTPLSVMYSVTNRCPARCTYCNIPDRKQSELTTKEVFSLIDQLVKAGTQRLALWGGEPLVRNDIGAIIDYAKLRGLYVSLDSNGYLVPERIGELKNLDLLVLGFDGPEKMNDRNREKGSYKKVMQAIEIAKERIPIWTITVLTKYNLRGIDFILRKAAEYDFQTTFQVIHHNPTLGKKIKSFLPSQDEYRESIRKLIRAKRGGGPIASSVKYLEYILNWPDYSLSTYPHPVGGLRCRAGQLYCNVDTDGTVYACSLLVGEVEAKNFLEVGFKEAFDYTKDIPCKACNASCFIEHNYLFSLNIPTVIERLRSLSAGRRD